MGESMHTRSRLVAVLSTVLVVAGLVAATGAQSSAAKAQGKLAFVQAVPGLTLTVAVDGAEVEGGVADGVVVGPVPLEEGPHEVTFTDESGTVVASTVEVASGVTSDVVIHRPAEVGGDPVVSVYPTPEDPIGPDKARVLLAHTATTAPADVEVDGTVVFQNIANGEFAQADVAAGGHRVALLPSGVNGDPILGPIDVDLKPGTVTAVYAVGNPRDGSMRVIVRETNLASDGTEVPESIETGSAGLVGDVLVRVFPSAD